MSTEQPRTSNRKKKVVAVVAGVAVLGTAGVAYAYWTADGTGTGSATTATTTPVVIAQTGSYTNLRPGLAAIPLTGTISNPAGNGSVKVDTLKASVTSVAPVAPATDCDPSDYTVVGGTTGVAVNKELAEGASTPFPSGLAVQFVNKSDKNQNGCKGATITITYTTVTS